MAKKELNKIVVLEPCTPAVEELLKKVEGANQAELIRLTNPEEAIQSVRQYQPCILVTCTINNADIPVRVNLLKKLETSIKSGVLKTLFVSKLKNRQLGSLISSLGVTDFIEEPVPARTLQFKANLQLKAVETVKKQQELKKASQEKIVFKKSEAKQDNGNAVTSESSAKRKPALSLEEDTFLFKNSGVKKVGKKTLVELEGPAPESGEWVPHEDKGDVKTSWRWVPNEKKDLPKSAEEKEGWVHEGEKPQFNEESGKWQFNSEKPDLSFQKKGEKIASKISTDESGEVVVAEDSPKAEENVKKEKEKSARKKEDRKKEDPRVLKEKTEKTEEDQAATLRAINREKNDKNSEEIKEHLKKSQEGEESDTKSLTKKKNTDLEDRLNRAMNKLGTEIPSTTEEEEATSIENKATPEEEAPKSPLDFLKKKREQKEKQKVESTVAKDESEPKEAEVIALKQNPSDDKTTEKKEFKATKEKEDKPKKSAADAAKEALERLKRKMDATTIGSTGEESDSEEDASKAFTENPEEEKESEQAVQIKSNEKERKKSETKLGNDTREKNRETAVKKETSTRMKPEERKAKKREILSKIQEVLGKPLPERMSSEEEEKLRKELGLENKREIPARELAKRAKLNKVRELKEQLEELNGYVEDSPEFREHDLKNDEPEDTRSQKGASGEKKSRRINAYDSDPPEESEPESEKVDSKSDKRSNEREKRAIEDRYVYLPESEVIPLGGAWESSGEYYIFLAATVRYKGFQKLEDLCPMLFYRGEKIPELLDKTKQWRFLDRLPIRAERAADIPKDIRDFLFSLKAQVQSEEKKKIEEEKEQLLEQEEAEKKTAKKNQDSGDPLDLGTAEPKKNREPSKLSNLLEDLENQARELEEKSATSEVEAKEKEEEEKAEEEKRNSSSGAPSSFQEPTKVKNDEKKSLKDLMASLEKEEAEQKEKYGELEVESEKTKSEFSSDEGSAEKNSKNEEKVSLAEEKEAEKNGNIQPESFPEEKAEVSSSNNLIEEDKEEKSSNRSKESNDLESRLAALKSKLDDPFPAEEETKTTKSETILEEAPKVKPEIPLESEGVENVKEKLKAGSEAIEKFLERRKQKKSKTSRELLPEKKDSQKELAQHSPYLSVYLAVSNAFGSSKDPTKSVQRILRSMEDAFGNCIIYIFFDKGPIESGTVEISSNGTGIGQKIPISSGLACPIQLGVGSEEGSFLGYLFLKPSGTREFFTGAEEDAANKVATSLWSILVSKESNEAKAA